MTEPTKAEINEFFKKLKQAPENKVPTLEHARQEV